VKRLIDLSIILLITPLLIPVLLLVSLIVWVKLGKPVFFIQDRPGFNNKVFKMVKFRTMRVSPNEESLLLSDADRLTSFGRFLRATSLDELPELWNVLKGDMSIVGPRPLLVEYLPLYSDEQNRRHDVKPGITGWAQVNGRNGIPWEEKFKLDVWYVDNQSFWLDLKIILMTIKKVLFRDGISAKGEATMGAFTGNDK